MSSSGASREPTRPKVYSFDVFDTCVTRRYAHPRDLFFELGLRLAPSHYDARRAVKFAKEFQKQRIKAEKRAYREARPRECATIREIYERFSLPGESYPGLEALVSAEVELERESIFPVPSTVARIAELRSSGHRIIFISDMYLPGSILAPILASKGVMQPGDALYVSCDCGLTKHSGNLYRFVLEREGISPEDLVHTGDNHRADVDRPGALGIIATHFADAVLNHHELASAGHGISRDLAASFLSALSRRSRLSVRMPPGTDGAHALDGLIHGVIAPFLVSYVDWVLEEAERESVDRLYFVARDGEVLHKIAKVLAPARSPSLRYLHGSRRAWVAPSAGADLQRWSRLLVVPGQTNSRKDILERAGLEDDALERIRAELGIPLIEWERPLSREAALSFVDALLGSERARTALRQSSARYLAVAAAYLDQEGLFDDRHWALVDAGWSLNSQAALAEILRAGGGARLPKGYYIALTRDHLPPDVAGPASAFVAPAGNIFSRRRVIIEHCFTPSTHRTTVGYQAEGGRIAPIFGEELRSPEELAFAGRVHEVAVAMATFLAGDPSSMAEFRRHRSEMVANAERFLRRPRKADASAMSMFGTVADLRHHRSFVQPLCRPLTLADLAAVVGMSFSSRLNFATPSFMWLEGSSALSPAYIRAPVSMMLFIDQLRQKWMAR